MSTGTILAFQRGFFFNFKISACFHFYNVWNVNVYLYRIYLRFVVYYSEVLYAQILCGGCTTVHIIIVQLRISSLLIHKHFFVRSIVCVCYEELYVYSSEARASLCYRSS